jgi:hypothetical protein
MGKQQLLQAVAQARKLPPGPLQQRQLNVLMGQLQQQEQHKQQLLAATAAAAARPQQALLMELAPALAWGRAGSKAEDGEVAERLREMIEDLAERWSVQPGDWLKQL